MNIDRDINTDIDIWKHTCKHKVVLYILHTK